MAKHLQLKGLNTVLNNIQVMDAKITKQVSSGLMSAGEFLKIKAIAKTPVDTGALVGSAFGGKDTPVEKTLTGLSTEVGFGNNEIEYAAAVHEMPGKLKGQPRSSGNGNYWDTSGEPKFLQNAAFRNLNKIRRLIVSKIRL